MEKKTIAALFSHGNHLPSGSLEHKIHMHGIKGKLNLIVAISPCGEVKVISLYVISSQRVCQSYDETRTCRKNRPVKEVQKNITQRISTPAKQGNRPSK
uniref:hypothetical protein n=1 Tax=Candidatus Electrothrix sp. TaxID=2170559 RepID=UPI004056B638